MEQTRLDDELIIETPERVELRYALASIGNRFLAAFIDHLFQAAIVLAVFIATGLLTNWAIFAAASTWTAALSVLAFFAIYWGYFVVFETLWSGQTPGKRIMRLRVVREDGRPVRFFEVFVRNVIRLVVDIQPVGSYAIGVVSIIFSPKSQRIGDFVGGTVVVKERAREAPSLKDIVTISEVELVRLEKNALAPFKADLSRLSDKDLRAVEGFLKRRYELPEPGRTALARRIAGSIVVKLGIAPGELLPEDVLEEVERQHRAQSWRMS